MLSILGVWQFVYTTLPFLENVPHWWKCTLAALIFVYMISVAEDNLENSGSFVRTRTHPFNFPERQVRWQKGDRSVESTWTS